MDIVEIVKRRGNPGILIYSASHALLYANPESLHLLPELRSGEKVSTPVLDEIRILINEALRGEEIAEMQQNVRKILPLHGAAASYHVQAYPIREKSGSGTSSLKILILIEKVAVKHTVNFDHVKTKFSLSKRETEVLKLLFFGLTNKEMADRLCICEYTVKDHMRSLMKKTGGSSRTELITRLM